MPPLVLITFLNVVKDLVSLALWGRLFHNWARGLGRANLFALFLRSYSVVNGLNRSCKFIPYGIEVIPSLICTEGGSTRAVIGICDYPYGKILRFV